MALPFPIPRLPFFAQEMSGLISFFTLLKGDVVDCTCCPRLTLTMYIQSLPDPSGSHRHQQGIAAHGMGMASRHPRASYRYEPSRWMVSEIPRPNATYASAVWFMPWACPRNQKKGETGLLRLLITNHVFSAVFARTYH